MSGGRLLTQAGDNLAAQSLNRLVTEDFFITYASATGTAAGVATISGVGAAGGGGQPSVNASVPLGAGWLPEDWDNLRERRRAIRATLEAAYEATLDAPAAPDAEPLREVVREARRILSEPEPDNEQLRILIVVLLPRLRELMAEIARYTTDMAERDDEEFLLLMA